MHIQVLLFGPQAAIAGMDRVSIDLDGQATAEQLFAKLRHALPALEQSLDSSRIAINHAYALPGDKITEDDEVALIGMVSGG